jgi:hypothetical protein
VLVCGLFRLGLGYIQAWSRIKVKFGDRQGLLESWFQVSVGFVLGFM